MLARVPLVAATLLLALLCFLPILDWLESPDSTSRSSSDGRPGLPSVSASGPNRVFQREAPSGLLTQLPRSRGDRTAVPTSQSSNGEPVSVAFDSSNYDPAAPRRVSDRVTLEGNWLEDFRVDYTLDSDLTQRVDRVLSRGRVKRGHVIVLDPASGRLLAYASTDPENFPVTRAYPAASLMKVVTAAAVLEQAPQAAARGCRFRGSPYRLTRARLNPPRHGRAVSFEGALATSNNQCFAQLAVNDLGDQVLLQAINRFGLLSAAAPGHAPGRVNRGTGDYDLGRLGCGLAGCRITPLHAARLAATLATGESVEPWWVERVLDSRGRELNLPERPQPQRVMSPDLADELRLMLVRTTTRGTARSAFRDRRGRPLLGPVQVAGKTGNLSGTEPRGRYEWFIGVAPAESPSVAVAVLQVHGDLWWKKSSEIAAEVYSEIFCESGTCSAELAHRYTGLLGDYVAPTFLSESGR